MSQQKRSLNTTVDGPQSDGIPSAITSSQIEDAATAQKTESSQAESSTETPEDTASAAPVTSSSTQNAATSIPATSSGTIDDVASPLSATSIVTPVDAASETNNAASFPPSSQTTLISTSSETTSTTQNTLAPNTAVPAATFDSSTSNAAITLPSQEAAQAQAQGQAQSPSQSESQAEAQAQASTSKPSEALSSIDSVPPAKILSLTSSAVPDSNPASKTITTPVSQKVQVSAQAQSSTGSSTSGINSGTSLLPTKTVIPFTSTTVSKGQTITTTGDVTSSILAVAQAESLADGAFVTLASGANDPAGTAKVGGADTKGSSDSALTKTQRQSGPGTGNIIAIVVSVVGGIAVLIVGIFLLRKYLRRRRIARAVSPPASPLLKTSTSIIHSARGGFKEKSYWDAGNMAASGDGLEKYGGGAPLSPLPSLEGLGTGFHNGDGMVGGLKLFPSSRVKTEGKELPKDF